jgi:hypothetical protein
MSETETIEQVIDPTAMLESMLDGAFEAATPAVTDDTPAPVATQDDAPAGLPDASTTAPAADDSGFGSPLGDDVVVKEPVVADPAADAAAFDAETEAELAKMATDPHPGVAFKKLREQLKEAKALSSAAASSQEDSEAMTQLRAEVELYKSQAAEVTELKSKVALNDYTATPEYEQNISQPFQDISSLAAILEGANSLDEGAIIKAIADKDIGRQNSAIEALVHKVDDRTRVQIYNMADKMTTLYLREDTIRENAAARLSDYNDKQATQTAVQQEQRAAEFGSAVESTFSDFESKVPSLLSDTGERSAEYAPLMEKAKALDFESLDDKSKGFAAMAAVTLPKIVADYNKMRTALAEKESLLGQYRGATPSQGAGTPGDTTKTPKKDHKEVLDDFLNLG